MKVVIIVGTLIIFISCFFIFFTFDSLIRSQLICTTGQTVSCNVTELNMTIIAGILIVGFFLFVDMLVVYLMVKTWVPGMTMYS